MEFAYLFTFIICKAFVTLSMDEWRSGIWLDDCLHSSRAWAAMPPENIKVEIYNNYAVAIFYSILYPLNHLGQE